VTFAVEPAEVPECESGEPAQVALENALRKARAVRGQRARSGEAVLGCDTVVALDGVLYGKPADERTARATLRALSGATHDVVSGLALLVDGRERAATACTQVSLRALDDATIGWYMATGEWRGRAGGYAVQGAGAALVRSVQGEYENVVGLPVATLLELCPGLLRGCFAPG
jgi:nucleoside triphosphate pyrophosphatase